MTLKDLHESWEKTGYPSRTEIRKAIEGLLAKQDRQPKAYQPTEWIAVPACCCALCEKARRKL